MSTVSCIVEQTLDRFSALYGEEHKVYDAPVYEERNGLYFIYFTSRYDGMISYGKRYHQLVVGAYGIECHYDNSNVIDIDKNYPLSDVRLRFKNRLNHLLGKCD